MHQTQLWASLLVLRKVFPGRCRSFSHGQIFSISHNNKAENKSLCLYQHSQKDIQTPWEKCSIPIQFNLNQHPKNIPINKTNLFETYHTMKSNIATIGLYSRGFLTFHVESHQVQVSENQCNNNTKIQKQFTKEIHIEDPLNPTLRKVH